MSFVTSPAQTRSQSARSTTASSAVPAAATSRARSTRHGRRASRGSRRAPAPSGRASGIGVGGARTRRWSRNSSVTRPSFGAERSGADPDEVAARRQGVEVGSLGTPAPAPEHIALEDRRRDRRALQATRSASISASGPPRGRSAPCHAGQESPEGRRVDGLDLARRVASDRRRILRRTSESHHSRSAPPGRNSPCTTRPSALERLEGRRATRAAGRTPSHAATSTVVKGACVRAYRATRSASGALAGLKCTPPAARRHVDAQRVAQPCGVLHGGRALSPAIADLDRPAFPRPPPDEAGLSPSAAGRDLVDW